MILSVITSNLTIDYNFKIIPSFNKSHDFKTYLNVNELHLYKICDRGYNKLFRIIFKKVNLNEYMKNKD